MLGHTYLAAAPDGTRHAVKELHPGWGPAEVTGLRVEKFLDHFRGVRKEPDTFWARHVMPTDGGYDDNADRAWLATPLLTEPSAADGGTTGHVSLATAVTIQPLPAEAALHLVHRLSELARRLHAQGLSLAGLTPSNLFLGPDGAVVVDVHLAFVLRRLLHPTGNLQDRARRVPFMWADPSWLPPELRRADASVRRSSSVHAVGAIAAFACTGVVPLPVIDIVDALAQRKAARRPAEEALAHWASHHGNAGVRLRKAAGRSTRRRPWSRPGAGRLKRIVVPPLWANHRISRYSETWNLYVELVQDKVRKHQPTGTGPRPPASSPAPSASTGQDTPRPVEAPAPTPGTAPARQTSPTAVVPGPGVNTPTPVPAPAPAPTKPTAGAETVVLKETTALASGGVATGGPRTQPSGGSTAPPSPAGRPADRTGAGSAPQPLWEWDTGGPLLCPPLAVGGLLVVTSGSSAHLLDAVTGQHHRTLALRGTAESAPVLWEGRLWWALRDGLLNGHDLGDSTGGDICLRLDGDPGPHSPVTVDDMLLAGTTDGLFGFRRSAAPGGATGRRVVALDEPVVSPLTTDGVRVWVPTERSGVLVVLPATGESHGPHQPWDAAGCAVTLAKEGVYTGDAAGVVRHLSTSGTTRLQWEASPHPITAPPVVHGDLLLVVDRKGTVAAQSLEHWTQRWRTLSDGDGRSPVTVLDGVVYVCGARSVQRLDVRSGQELKPLTSEGPQPLHVTATPGGLHVGFVDGHLSTWSRPG
ncbi:PQQ-binding-like beta-propeller repeat protein [Streptomyces sp. NPDC093094]|uniref:outer membrane protein assembly factor BamB family protein n=1 Tax=Streptomyces sp. NPDC093094 TaxID=3366026 RepID=UPI00382D550E